MSRYIDESALLSAIKKEYFMLKHIRKTIANTPSIDIVRCKECKWAKANGTYQWCGRLDSTARITADDFCSYGERAEQTEPSTDCDTCKHWKYIAHEYQCEAIKCQGYEPSTDCGWK